MSTGEGMQIATPLVSVVIPTFRRPERVRRAVLSLLSQDLGPKNYEIIVVDSSPDNLVISAVTELQRSAPCALRSYAKPAEGPGPSRNLGVRQARADFIAFMDSDCEASSGWLRAGLDAFEEGVGIVQGRTLADPKGKQGVFTWCPTTERENFVYECTSIFYRRQAFEEGGGFNRDLTPHAENPFGGEDVELAWKVKRKGWKTRFAVRAVVYHEVVQVSVWRWLYVKRLYLWPSLTRKIPELRQFFFARYFWDQAQAYLILAAIGAGLAWFSPLFLPMCLPYVILRSATKSKSFPGILRPLRVLPYLARDTVWFLLLLYGSVRSRCLLL